MDGAIFEFTVLHKGWELDNAAWVVERSGKRVLVTTSHGGAYVAEPKEFEEKIAEYESLIADTRKALALLGTSA